ncbi:MBOAT-domain-containing protein [Dacryopinax primogenitus]|uniref:O-acyltransferase n=1 Tax=Dacryopinax primogenitus (strain DJM 731) TaxID=1858805 RepID=M5FQA2_DACPD|nr:MBOAT-domain-containing protein [Dacryopinax primogenitus]EJT97603.1 MBOAT-domain-containing protein [Dacryopinax primogenitus]
MNGTSHPHGGHTDVQTASISTQGSKIETAEGTIHVQPFRPRGSKHLRAVVSFTPRISAFDRENATSGQDQFRGFYTLFWIAMFLLIIRTFITSYEQNGYPLSLAFASLFSRDAKTLALSDGVLVLSTGMSVLLMKAVKRGWFRYWPFGAVLHYTWMVFTLVAAITWTFNRQWPWVQSGFLTLHAMVMCMKVHSYLAVNGYLSDVHRHAESLERQLRALCVSESEGWEHALEEAQKAREKQETSTEDSPIGTPALLPEGATTKGYAGGNPIAEGLRPRIMAMVEGTPAGSRAATPPLDTTIKEKKPYFTPIESHQHPLFDHPNNKISELAEELGSLEQELTSVGLNRIRWPANVTFTNFADYMLIPTLVYELEYPRTDRIRPTYLFEKTVATFGTFTLLYTVTEHYIMPLTPRPDQSFFRSLIDLALPFMLCYIILFYLIFECICNAFAELSRFADRQFYEDWWNSVTFDEFARKWNKPVHTFFLRHVYASTISSYKISKSSAMWITFLLSAVMHELVMAIVTKKFRMYLFMMQMCQIPMIFLGRLPAIKKNKTLGNVVFWMSLMAGFPLLCVAYVAY